MLPSGTECTNHFCEKSANPFATPHKTRIKKDLMLSPPFIFELYELSTSLTDMLFANYSPIYDENVPKRYYVYGF